MGFLSPWFLAGVAAIGLPVWLHLLKQHKTTPFRFSSLMFFERRTQSSVKHRRLKYLALFAMRVALLLLLILAFAHPYIMRGVPAGGGGRKLLVIAIDNSFSMRESDRLARARQEAKAALAELRSGDEAQVLAFGSGVQLMTQPTNDKGQLVSAIDEIELGDSRSSYAELSRALRSIGASSRASVEAHVFTDIQKSSLPPSFADLQVADGTKLSLHSLAPARVPNFALENVTAPARVYNTRQVRIQATIAGYGAAAGRRSVSLVLNGKEIERKEASVPAEGRATVEFHGLEAPHGFNRGEVRIDSADTLAADDTFFFAIERAEPSRALFVHEARQPRGLLYFREALDSASNSAFILDALTAAQVNNADLSKYRFVVLSDVASVSSAAEEALKAYLQQGGSVLIAAGPALGTRARIPVTGDEVIASRYSSRAAERFQSVASVDTSHPSLQSAGQLDGIKFYQTVEIAPGDSRVLIRLADRRPLLLEKTMGAGRALTFASTFDNISNDFPLHAAFVPFVEQAARYLAGHAGRSAGYLVDSHLELRGNRDDGVAFEVLDPRGQRALTLAEAAKVNSLQLSEAGFYQINRANGQREMVAVNADRNESDLDIITGESLALWENTGRPAEAAAAATGASEEKRWDLWWFVMLAVLLTAIAESMFGSRYLAGETPEKVQGEIA